MGQLEEHVLRSRIAGRHDAQTYAELVDHGWTPRDVRLALLRAPRAPAVQTHAPGRTSGHRGAPVAAPAAASVGANQPSDRSRWFLAASVALGAVPAAAVATFAVPTLLAVVVVLVGGAAPWTGSTARTFEAVLSLGSWLSSAYLASLALLLVGALGHRARDPWGRPLPRSRPTSALTVLSTSLLVLTPLMAVGGFVLFVMTAVVCGETPTMCR